MMTTQPNRSVDLPKIADTLVDLLQAHEVKRAQKLGNLYSGIREIMKVASVWPSLLSVIGNEGDFTRYVATVDKHVMKDCRALWAQIEFRLGSEVREAFIAHAVTVSRNYYVNHATDFDKAAHGRLTREPGVCTLLILEHLSADHLKGLIKPRSS